MPELPEVETIRRDLEKTILKRTIEAIEIIDGRVVRQPLKMFQKRLLDQRIEKIFRRGKSLSFALSGGEHLVVQVMMTGQLVAGSARQKHTRLVFTLSGGKTLLYNDQRIFGQMRVVKDLQEIKYYRFIGPEPFEQGFSADYIRNFLKKTKRPIKNVLLDHTFVAGIGNIYACEILSRCGISPQRCAHRIKIQEVHFLLKESRAVLQEAITYRGSSVRNYRDGAGEEGTFNRRLRVYAKEGQKCAQCQNLIKRITQSGRGSFYCPHCQK